MQLNIDTLNIHIHIHLHTEPALNEELAEQPTEHPAETPEFETKCSAAAIELPPAVAKLLAEAVADAVLPERGGKA